MAFNVGISSKEAFRQLKQLTPKKRVEVANGPMGASMLSMLTPVEFAELFPKYYQRGLPDVGGFRDAVSKMSRQKQDDINFGLSRGAKSLEEAEQMGSWRRRGGNTSDGETVSSTLNGPRGKFSAANYVAILKQAGFSQKDAVLMAAVGMQESNGNVGAHNDANPNRERSYGLFQVNINAHKFGSPEMEYAGVKSIQDLYDPIKNAKVAYYLYYKGGGIHHWGGFTDGGYKKYLSAAEAAAGTPAGIPSTSGTQNFDTVSNSSHKSGGFYGESEQCVALSKHFSGLGAASGWKVRSGNIVPGSVIATMSYNDGSGGKMARNMPDGRSHYHTGIALTSPNEKGEVLILEQFAGQGARVRSININDYNGEKWGVVEGGDPNAGTMKAVEIGKGLANEDQLAWIHASTGQTDKPKASVEVKPTQEAAVAKPTLTTNQGAPQYPEGQQQEAPAQTAKVQKPDASKKTVDSYKFDPDKYWNEVKTKQPMADSMFYGKDKVMKMTYQGFEEAQAAGAIKWNRKTNEIQILDPNHEKVQAIYKDMQDNNIDRNAFMTKSEAGASGSAKVHKGAARAIKREHPTMKAVEQAASVKVHDAGEPMDLEKLMAIVRRQESGSFEGNYKADLAAKQVKKGQRHDTASGAYQYNNKTWKGVLEKELKMPHILQQYPRAVDAPKEVQDQITKARFQKFRDAGYSDNEIILHHFTGNKQGKLSAAAQKGNPTPAQYRAQIASHVAEYDKTVLPTLVAQQKEAPARAEAAAASPAAPIQKAEPVTATAAVKPTTATPTMAERARSLVSPLIGPPAAVAAPKKEEAPVPQPTGSVDFAPPEMKAPQIGPPAPMPRDKQSMNMERPQNPVSINPLEQRPAHMQPTPSLARAMDNARGVVSSNYTSLTNTKLG